MDLHENQVCWGVILLSWAQATLALKLSKSTTLLSPWEERATMELVQTSAYVGDAQAWISLISRKMQTVCVGGVGEGGLFAGYQSYK